MNRRNFLGLIGITATGVFLWPRETVANIPPIPPCGKCTPYSEFKITTERPLDEQAFIRAVNENFEKAHGEMIRRLLRDTAHDQNGFKELYSED